MNETMEQMAEIFKPYDLSNKALLCEVALARGFNLKQFDQYGWAAIELAATRRSARRNPVAIHVEAPSVPDGVIGVIALGVIGCAGFGVNYALPFVWAVFA